MPEDRPGDELGGGRRPGPRRLEGEPRPVDGPRGGPPHANVPERVWPALDLRRAVHPEIEGRQARLGEEPHPRRRVAARRREGDLGRVRIATGDREDRVGPGGEGEDAQAADGGDASPVTVPRLELEGPFPGPGDDAVRSGPDGAGLDRSAASAPGDERKRQLVQEEGVGGASRDPDGVRSDGLDPRDGPERSPGVGVVGRARPLERLDDGGRVEGGAVVERHSRAQGEEPGRLVGRLPPDRERRTELEVAVVRDEGLEDVREDREGARLAQGRVERRDGALQDDADGTLRRGRARRPAGGNEHEEAGQER